MNLLKRETIVPTARLLPWYLCLTAIVAFMTYAAGLRDGLTIGANVDTQVQPSGCGISDPVGCLQLLLEELTGDVSPMTESEPLPEVRITFIESHIVVCGDVESAYEACLADETCETETLGKLALDLLDCMPPARL